MSDVKAEATKVAIITGGTSGIGFAVTEALAQRPNWHIHILGKNPQRGHEATEKLGNPNVVYHQCDVINYQELATVFQTVFRKHGRLDHVFANAGISDMGNSLAKKDPPQTEDEGIPPEPNAKPIDVNFTSVLYTSHLALHYFRLSPEAGKGASLVFNGSVAALHPATIHMAVYSATKHGVLGLMRCMAGDCWKEGIRVNILCLGPTMTNILEQEIMETYFKPEQMCPLDLIAKNTLPLIDGSEIVASDGSRVSGDEIRGLAIEILGSRVFVKPQVVCNDEDVRGVLFPAT